MSQFTPEPEMTEFEQSLAALSPSRGALDRDRLMFEAGRRSATSPSRLRWAWPAVAASLTVVALGQTFALSRRPEPRVVERVVIVREPTVDEANPVEPVVILSRNTFPPQARSDDPISAGANLSLRRQIERYGLEGLPNPSPFLTFSTGTGDPSEAPLNDSTPLRPYDLEKFLDTGGPS